VFAQPELHRPDAHARSLCSVRRSRTRSLSLDERIRSSAGSDAIPPALRLESSRAVEALFIDGVLSEARAQGAQC
jgi:hypothetical protein